jgi:aminoglycoside phosphotransferase (APT) family kinase protein
VTRYRALWTETKTRELPLIESVGTRLAEMRPPQRYTGIVHSDYRLGNVMLGEDGTLTGVLDWELWTLGDVLSDVGFLLNNWYEPTDTIPLIWMEVPPTMAGGFASRTEVLERYAARTGFDLSDVPYYRAFQYWKVAILAEGVKRRYETAQMVSETVDFAHMNKRVIDLVDLADLSLRELR